MRGEVCVCVCSLSKKEYQWQRAHAPIDPACIYEVASLYVRICMCIIYVHTYARGFISMYALALCVFIYSRAEDPIRADELKINVYRVCRGNFKTLMSSQNTDASILNVQINCSIYVLKYRELVDEFVEQRLQISIRLH